MVHLGPNELAHVAPIAHLGKYVCMSYPLARALKTCADEVSPKAQAGKHVQMSYRL